MTAYRTAAPRTFSSPAVHRLFGLFLLLSLTLGLGAEALAQATGLPLPRFVSLRAGEVNMRAGPGVQYPVDWVYKRKFLPMEVIAEHQTWRKVRDHQGTQGWVHQSMLASQRTGVILGKQRTLRAESSSDSPPVAKLQPDVIVRLLDCPGQGGWCRVRVSGFEGWLRRVELWGIRDDEGLE